MSKAPASEAGAPRSPRRRASRGGAGPRQQTRQCVATRARSQRARLIRFVIDGDGRATPDLAEKLPGRGFWISADRAALSAAVKKSLFSKAARRKVIAEPDLPDRVEALLAKRCLEGLGLARRAGLLTFGFDKIVSAFRDARPFALVEAMDGAADGRSKLLKWAGAATHQIPVIGCFTSDELDLAFARVNVIHIALLKGGASDRLLRDVVRLSGFRPIFPAGWPVSWDPRSEGFP